MSRKIPISIKKGGDQVVDTLEELEIFGKICSAIFEISSKKGIKKTKKIGIIKSILLDFYSTITSIQKSFHIINLNTQKSPLKNLEFNKNQEGIIPQKKLQFEITDLKNQVFLSQQAYRHESEKNEILKNQ